MRKLRTSCNPSSIISTKCLHLFHHVRFKSFNVTSDKRTGYWDNSDFVSREKRKERKGKHTRVDLSILDLHKGYDRLKQVINIEMVYSPKKINSVFKKVLSFSFSSSCNFSLFLPSYPF